MKLYPSSVTASNNPYGSFYQHFKAVDDADAANPMGDALSAVWSFSAGTTGLSMSGEADNRPWLWALMYRQEQPQLRLPVELIQQVQLSLLNNIHKNN